MAKLLSMLFLTLLSLQAYAQTSSRFRNEVINNTKERADRISRFCEARADRQFNDPSNTVLGYFSRTYRGKFLNDCLQSHKMGVMNGHAKLLQARIAKLRERRDQTLNGEIRGLAEGLRAYQVRIGEERAKYKSSCYERRGLDETSVDLLRHIRRLLTEHYEMRAEMEYEGTL